ncbi:MAG: hypothetical protein AABY18_01585 [Candidatus Thermoplasmatota archaeon]
MRALAPVALLAVAFLAGCSDGATDEDGDGLRDATEKDWPGLIVDYMDRRVRLEGVTSDSSKQDTDGDGLSDFDEYFLRTDPRAKDTDRDGLTDCQERVHTVALVCEDFAYDGDYDGGYGTNPTRADSDPGPVRFHNREGVFVDETGTLPGGHVEWGDGVSDGDEVLGYVVELAAGRTRTVTTDPRARDTDRDGLEDGEEAWLYSSDPLVEDTDGDSCLDGQDPVPSETELFVLGLRTFLLKVDKDASGSDLLLSGQLVGQSFVLPPSGSIAVQREVVTDISNLDPPAMRARQCPLTPLHPWARIQIDAEDPDAGATQDIDIISSHGFPAGSIPVLEWNVLTGEFRWESTKVTVQTPISLEGAEGRLVLEPEMRFRQGS